MRSGLGVHRHSLPVSLYYHWCYSAWVNILIEQSMHDQTPFHMVSLSALAPTLRINLYGLRYRAMRLDWHPTTSAVQAAQPLAMIPGLHMVIMVQTLLARGRKPLNTCLWILNPPTTS